MQNVNSILIAGPLSNAKVSVDKFSTVIRARIATINVTIRADATKPYDKNIIDNIASTQAAVLYDATLNSEQDKKDPSKMWHNVNATPNRLSLINSQIEIVNRAHMVGKVVQTNDRWLTLACSYKAKEEWKNRYVYVLTSDSTDIYRGKMLLVLGAVRPGYQGTWFIHVEAEKVVVLQ